MAWHQAWGRHRCPSGNARGGGGRRGGETDCCRAAAILDLWAPCRGVRIRRAGPGDVASLVPLVDQLHRHEGLVTGPRTEAALRGLLTEADLGFVLVAESRTEGGSSESPGDLAGYAVVGFGYSLEFEGRDAFVDELYVEPRYRGQGVGRQLLGAVEAMCRDVGVRAVHLEVGHDNARALRLYERLGYQAHPRHLMTKWVGDAERVRAQPD